jgi:hypothetical protein
MNFALLGSSLALVLGSRSEIAKMVTFRNDTDRKRRKCNKNLRVVTKLPNRRL